MHQKTKCYSLIIFLIVPHYLEASPSCTQPVAKVVSVQGKVDRQYSGHSEWQIVQADDSVCGGDKIRTEKWSCAILMLSNESLVTLDQSTTLVFSEPEPEQNKITPAWLLKLIDGSAFFRSRQPQHLNIETPFINAVHKGTEFLVTVDDQQTKISVFDGQVAGENKAGRIQIKKGFSGIAQKNRPPRLQALTITPENAVQWTLYYPPVIDYEQQKSSISTPSLKSALKAYQQGDVYKALVRLNEVPVTYQDSGYLTLKASLLLTVGRADEALDSINRALRMPHDHSAVLALQSIIAVAKNQQEKALDLALKAVALNPKSSAAKIALSYAYQSLFKIKEALIATQEATQITPDNALAWARLAELQLSMGDHDSALVSAQKAQRLNPKLASTQTIVGFADLAQFDFNAGKKAFEQAIAFDSSYPLARLGLGLAKIRKGALEDGKKDLETAVSLDPDNAVIRSYLGKAYYELRNKDNAGTEYKIAKEMDPKDPTSWFYDAILKQTTNRPVEALHDMQKAIELNDNRGVYRSSLLIDEDLAARSASLGRIYNDLGFQKLGLLEGWKSINTDPGNYSAHRLLADNYSALPGHDIARVSESLQTQLLQPINITPVLAQMAEANLKSVDHLGPGSLSLNEFNPLFAHNGVALRTSGIAGSNNSLGDEVILSGLWNQYSFNLNQFHYETDGIKQNDNINQNLYSAFTQVAVTPNTSLQIELRKKITDYGDIALRINDFHRPNYRDSFDEDTIRGGLNYSPVNNHTFLSSFIYKQAKQQTTDSEELGGDMATHFNNLTKSHGYQTESQYLFHGDRINLIAGGGYSNQPFDMNRSFQVTETGNLLFEEKSDVSDRIENYDIYTYAPIILSPYAKMTLGLSVDSLNQEQDAQTQVNPKIGLFLTPTALTTIRYASFRTLKRPVLSNQTLEPTQVAGFNQFFDDTNGTRAWRHGVGLDQRFSTDLYGGFELTKRSLNGGGRSERNEYYHRAYLNWTPSTNFALSADYSFEDIKRGYEDGFVDPTQPVKTLTHTVPLSIGYFMENGFFARLTSTYVNQEVDFAAAISGTENFDSQFWNTDFSIGYRLPRRYGLIKLTVNNIANRHFAYQSPDTGTGEPLSPLFQPERFISSTINLAF